MGLFDKKSKNTTNVRETNVDNSDNRLVEADRAIVGGNINITQGDNNSRGGLGGDGGGNISITTTDFGALDTASNIADGAFELSNNSLNRVGESVSSAVGALRNVAKDAVDVAKSASQDESARTMQFVILGLTVAGVAFFFRGPIKKAFK